MELRQLRYFVALAEERNFTRAAERLKIAQSALSQQIKALERSLGVTLVDRDPRPIRLTGAGKQLLSDATAMIELADQAAERARLGGQKQADLRLGGSFVGIGPVADALMQTFRVQHPDVHVHLHPDATKENIRALNRRELDAVFVYAPYESPTALRYLGLDTFELLLTLKEDHPLASLERVPRQALLDDPFLLWPRNLNPTFVDHVHRLVFGQTGHPHGVEVPDLGVSKWRLTHQGAAIGPIAFPMEALMPTPGLVFLPFEEPAPQIESGVVWLEDPISAATAAFLELATEMVDVVPTAHEPATSGRHRPPSTPRATSGSETAPV
jgi:DNA-binding transcriptional LysR family regulator